ncbi:MAG: hypothetical protein Fur0021_18450 [Candidatus Promineifilaceae bacterium]
MSLEGLQAILDKEEIVATQRAEDLLTRPEIVDRVYQGHVRTYIPLGRQASGGENGQSVVEFERRVIREVKQAGAIRGYITAEYGHGKTSTALYLWQRARNENILAVPPFQLNKLTDFIRATYGWVRYEIQRTRPQSTSVPEADILYNALINRSAESIARKYEIAVDSARRMAREKPEILELTPADYIGFFEEMTRLAQEAGFEGLLILADELQQYIDPEIKQGIKDPISPFFDIVSAILTRRNHLKFGLIVVIPPKELEQLRDGRGDLIHRVLQVSLDLRTVYNQEFPQRLWERLAKEFNFQEHQRRIISADCLVALGQIGARGDLSDGPRTVVNTLRRATRRYIEAGYPADTPYTPETLVSDLLQGHIQYDSSKRIAQVTARVLAHSLVKGQPERERAVKWAAAFPNEGVPMSLQESQGLATAFNDLAQSGLGDLIISVGDVRNRGFTLRDLQEAPVKTDWLSLMLREFGRNYYETAAKTEERALKGFLSMLKTKVFPANQWTATKEVSARLTQNTGLLFEGSFTSSRQKYPERTVHVRVLWEDEAIKDAHAEGDALVEIRLRRYLDLNESERRYQAYPMEIDYDSRCLRLTLNLMRRASDPTPDLEEQVHAYISPFKLTPLLLLTLYQALDEERERNAIPKADDQFIQYSFQVDLMEHAFRELLNETVGAPVEAAQERVIELGLHRLLEATYPDYEPLVVVSNWTSSLQKYRNALAHLETNYERQGQVVVEDTKEQIANLFTLSNTGLDSFARNFPLLIADVAKLPGKGKGAVRFTLHPLEKAIKHWLQASPQTEKVQVGGKLYELHRLPNHEIYDRARAHGYLEKEIDAILELMGVRGMIEQDTRRGYVREAATQAPSVDELESEVEEWLAELQTLQAAFPADQLLRKSQEEAARAKQFVAELRVKPNEAKLITGRRHVQNERQQLSVLTQEKHRLLLREADNLFHRAPILEIRVRSNLEKPLQGNVEYVVQVDDFRSRLFKQYASLENDVLQWQQRIQAIQSSLRRESLELNVLVKLAGDVQTCEPRLLEIKQRHDAFQVAFKQYAEWMDLVTRGSQLREEIQQLGELVAAQNQQFQQLSYDIRGHLSASKIDALPDAPTYSVRLNELAEAVRQIKAEATHRFTTLQERYHQSIVNQLGFPSTQLWQLHQYNPVAPQASYDRLRDDVQQTMRQKVCQQLSQKIEEEQKAISSTLQSPLFRELPPSDQSQLKEQGTTLTNQLNALRAQLDWAIQETEDTSAINDFPTDGGGRFALLMQTLRQIYEALKQLSKGTRELSAHLTELKLTPEEAVLMQALQTEQRDLAELRSLAVKLSEEAFWKALGGLSAKRRVNITISPVRYD